MHNIFAFTLLHILPNIGVMKEKSVFYHTLIVNVWCIDLGVWLHCFVGLLKERPILGDHPKAHKTLYEKCCAFHEKHCTFCEKHCAFHEKPCTFCKKHLKSEKQHWKATKTADSTQISHLDLVFHRVQREGQLCICFDDVSWCTCVFVGACGACMCMWCIYAHIYVFGGAWM